MRKKPLPFLTLAILFALGACSNEEILSDANSATQQGNKRTLSLTASMPQEPTTYVGLEQKEDGYIALTWEAGDKLQLAFVQGATKVKQTDTLTVENITNEGKNAKFNITIPNEIVDGMPFNLYGVYGGGRINLSFDIGLPGGGGGSGSVNIKPTYTGDALVLGDENTNPYIKLPTNVSSATSLEDVQRRKDVMLYFSHTNIDPTNPQASVIFQHIGSLFNITFKNTQTGIGSGMYLGNSEMHLLGMGDDKNWAYNSAVGGQTFDLITGKFQNTETAGNYISFKIPKNTTINAGESITLWGWYPPLPSKHWPELQLKLYDVDNGNYYMTSTNTKPARTAPTPAGKAYYFYAEDDGTNISFTDA